MIFAIEPLSMVWEEMMVLALEHWKETEMYANGEKFAPEYERYFQYEKAGWYVQFTARDKERLVGHCGMYVVPSMHTQKVLATEDTWFLTKEYRKGGNAIKFYEFVESEMKNRGVKKISMTAAPYNGAGRIMEYLGYKLSSYQYSKYLEGNADSVNPDRINIEEHTHV